MLKKRLKAIPYMLLTGLMIALTGAFYRLGAHDFDVPTLVLFRTGICLFYVIVLYRGFFSLFHTQQLGLQMVRASAGTLGIFALYLAIDYIGLADALTLYLLSPFFVPILSYLWKGTPIIHRLWWGIGIAFLGVVFLLRPTGAFFQFATLLGLLSGLTSATVLLCMRFLHTTDHTKNILGYFFTFSFLASLLIWLIFSRALPSTMMGWTYLLLSGVAALLSQHFMTTGVKHAPVRMTSPLLYSSLLFAVPFDYYVFHQVPTGWQWVGMSLVVAGSILLTLIFPRTPTALEQ